MKKILLLLIGLTVISCSSDDDDDYKYPCQKGIAEGTYFDEYGYITPEYKAAALIGICVTIRDGKKLTYSSECAAIGDGFTESDWTYGECPVID